MLSRRRYAYGPQVSDSGNDDALQDTGGSARPRPKDPAEVAAGVLLARALSNANLPVDLICRDGAVALVQLPDVMWSEHVRSAWARLARSGQAGTNWDSSNYSFTCDWIAWCPSDQPRLSAMKQANESFAQFIAEGLHVAAFAADVAWLPTDLVFAADHQISIPAPTPEDFLLVKQELFDQSGNLTLSDDEASRLTPRLLRLARRLEQSADEYVTKLRDLLARELAPVVSAAAPVFAEPTLDRLHGMDAAVAWGKQLQVDLDAYRRGEISWADVDRGCLISGPPGCGKTVFARALATTCGVPLIAGSYGEWHGSGTGHQGDFLRAMQKSFHEARAQSPSILFIDEIDSFPDRARLNPRYASYETQVVNSVLAEIDGVQSREGVVLIGACNHPHKLDSALARSGRLDRHIQVSLPDRTALALILREHLGAADLTGADLSEVAALAVGSSGADCERFVRGARRRARLSNRAMVITDLVEEISGPDELSEADLWLTAVHEAGHAVATCVLRPGSLNSVAIGGRGQHGGVTSTKGLASIVMRQRDLHEQLVILLAGRAAEEELLGVASSGAGGTFDSDLGRATELVVNASAARGLGLDGDLLWRGVTDETSLRGMLAADPAFRRGMRAQIDEAYLAAWQLVTDYADTIREVAGALLIHRVLDRDQVQMLFRTPSQSV